MGCAQSKVDNEETVARCRNRKRHMKEAVGARNAFAAAHSSYAVALKHTGAALSEYGQGELGPLFLSSSSSNPPPPAAGGAPPPPVIPLCPPPRPDDFAPPSPPPLQRSISMPEMPLPKPSRKSSNPNPTISEEDEDPSAAAAADSAPPPPPKDPPTPPPPRETPSGLPTWDFFFPSPADQIPVPAPSLAVDVEATPPREQPHFERPASPTPPPVAAEVAAAAEVRRELEEEEEGEDDALPPQRLVRKKPGEQHHRAASAGTGKGKGAGHVSASVNLVQLLNDLDDHFLRASESAQDVTKMLEATRLHYHSNFADNRGHIDHSARVMKVITWNRSFKGMPDADDGKDDFDNEEWETHATILDKLLAWEKKLYDEVKAGELMKISYQRKLAQLERHKKRNSSTETLEKTKAAVSHMQTRLIVDMQSMDSTVSEIQRLRDEQLYVKLSALVDGMAKMWESMHKHHESQQRLVGDLRALDISSTPTETTPQHFDRTEQLFRMTSDWHTHFRNLMSHQKEYVTALGNWLKINIIPIESNLKEKVSSPPRIQHPPIEALVHVWHEQMDKLPCDIAQSAISSFAAVINSVMLQQQEELKLKQRCEEWRKDYERKERAFREWCEKHFPAGVPSEESEQGGEGGESGQQNAVAERQQAVDLAKQKLEQEKEELQKMCKQVREKAVGSLKSHLPELIRAMTDFSFACSEMYKHLRTITMKRSQAGPRR